MSEPQPAGGPAATARATVEPSSPGRAGVLLLVAVVAALGAISFLLRLPCLDPAYTGVTVIVPGCHGDLEAMWFRRGLAEGYVPYLQPFTDPSSGQLMTVEYPVLTGVLMWLFSIPGDFGVFLALGTLAMTAAAAGIALILHRWIGGRAWLWAAAPALVHYLGYNYDALPALTVVGALFLLRGDPPAPGRARVVLAAVLLGVGGALKLYPLLFVLPVGLWLLYGRPGPDQAAPGRRVGAALGLAGVAAGVFVAVNLPFALANPTGWWLPFQFQASRPIDLTTLSVWAFAQPLVPTVTREQWLLVSTVATAVGVGVAAAGSWLAASRRGRYPLLGSALAVLIAYVLLNKVFSPQYILWLLPLLVLAGVGRGVVLAYGAIDVVMFWAMGSLVFGRTTSIPALATVGSAALVAAVVLRVLVLARAATRVFGELDGLSAATAKRTPERDR